MRYVVHLVPGAHWIAGKSVHEQDRVIMGAHLRHMRKLYDVGQLLFGGPYKPEHGGMAIIEASSVLAATGLIEADPAVQAGVLTSRVYDIRPHFDAFAGVAWSAEG